MEQQVTSLPENFSNLIDLVTYFNDEKVCFKYLEEWRWNNQLPTCPHCGNQKAYRFSDGKRFKCSGCRKQFTAKIGTIFEDSKVSLKKWFVAIYLVTSHKKGISSHQLAKDIDVTQKTSWFMLHRIRWALGQDTTLEDTMGGEGSTVEIDETFVGGKNKNRHKSKKVQNSQGRSYKDKTPVMGMVERNGVLRALKVCDTKSETLQPIIEKHVKSGGAVHTDEWWGYRKLNEAYQHSFVNHGASQYCDGNVHTNTIEGFWSLFKRSIFGIYHSASSKHIQAYVDEAVFRYNTRTIGEGSRVTLTIVGANRPLKYKQLIEKA